MSKVLSLENIEKFRRGEYVPCEFIHKHSCEVNLFIRFLKTARFCLFFYGPAHVLPVVLFKLKKLIKDPVPLLKNLGVNIARSCTFGGVMLSISLYALCIFNKWFKGTRRLNWWLATPIASPSILIEAQSRKQELTIYLLPRALETVWNMLKVRGLVKSIKYFEVFLFCTALGTLMYFVHNKPQEVKSSNKSSLEKFYGIN